MASFISIHSSAASLDGGDILIGVSSVLGVDAASSTSTVIKMNGGVIDECTVTHTSTGVGAAAIPSLTDAIIYALTANPGGVNAKVHLPAGITVSNVVWS